MKQTGHLACLNMVHDSARYHIGIATGGSSNSNANLIQQCLCLMLGEDTSKDAK